MQTRLWWSQCLGVAEPAFGGSLESGGLFCVGASGSSVASGAVMIFHTGLFKKDGAKVKLIYS
jgi:hypothetical protein